jgi:hypothetical protein
MEDVRSIIMQHIPKKNAPSGASRGSHVNVATTSEIPDIFFDEILIRYKLSRVEILVLMLLYRQVWCRPNLYKEFGIGPVQTYHDMATGIEVPLEVLQQTLRVLENHGFIETIRAGQYFVRKYFTAENDARFGQSYNDFV